MQRMNFGLAILLCACGAFANVPTQISYQGQLRNNGSPAEGQITFTFRIFDQKTEGTKLWTETAILTVTNGIFDAFLGANAPLPPSIFTGAPLWLEVEVDAKPLAPRHQLVTVPYSFRAEEADHATLADTALVALQGSGGEPLWDTNGADVWRLTGNVGIGNSSPARKLAVAGDVELNDIYGNDAGGPTAIFSACPSGSAFRIYTKGAGGEDKQRMEFSSGTDTGLVFFTDTHVVINENLGVLGSIGIGLEPTYKLDVNGSIRTLGDLRAENAGNALVMNHDGANAVLSTTSGSIWLNPSGPYLGIGGGKTLRIQDTSGSRSIRMVHNQTDGVIQTPSGSGDIVLESGTGHVGIGMEDPSYTLDVDGTIHATNIIADNFDDGDWTIGDGVLTTDDRLGIGVANPDEKYHVQIDVNTDFDQGEGLHVVNHDTNHNTFAIYGESESRTNGIPGNQAGAGSAVGVYGRTSSTVSSGGATLGVLGVNNAETTEDNDVAVGVFGWAPGTFGPGDPVAPFAGRVAGVWGESWSTSAEGSGVVGKNLANNGNTSGVYGSANSPNGSGIRGYNSAGGLAGYFVGNVQVTGTLSKAAGSFRIDHPLDPMNMYLSHSFVESPDMMNVYNGNVVLDANGEARISFPAWFESLNRDFRYQLTAIGAPGPSLHVSEEIEGNGFSIAGGSPGLKVSWQVTGIRQDPYANAHRIVVEEEKSANDRGKLLHPAEYGSSADQE